MVVAFGGDGTLNEVANGLAGTDVPVSVLPGRLDQRRLPHAGDPERRRRRHRAPAGPGRRLQPAQDRSRRRERPPLRVRLRRGDRRHRGQTSGLQPQAQASWRPLVLHYWAAVRLLHRVPAQPGPDARRGRGTGPVGGRHGARPELRSVHLLRAAARARLRRRRPRRRHPVARGPAPSRAARRPDDRLARALSERLQLADHRQIDHFEGLTEARIESISRDREDRIRRSRSRSTATPIGDHGELDLGIEPGALDRRCLSSRLSLLRDRRWRGRGARRLRGRRDRRLPRQPPAVPGPLPADPARAPRGDLGPPRRAGRALLRQCRARSRRRSPTRWSAKGAFVAMNNIVSQSRPPPPHPPRPPQPQGRAARDSSGRVASTPRARPSRSPSAVRGRRLAAGSGVSAPGSSCASPGCGPPARRRRSGETPPARDRRRSSSRTASAPTRASSTGESGQRARQPGIALVSQRDPAP